MRGYVGANNPKNVVEILYGSPHFRPDYGINVFLYMQEMCTDKAIELLREQLKTHSTAQLHQMLADLLAKTHDEEQSLEHYTIGKHCTY